MRGAESVRVPSGGILYGSHLQFRADLRRRLGKRFLIGMAVRSPFALAGLWGRWKNPEGKGGRSDLYDDHEDPERPLQCDP